MMSYFELIGPSLLRHVPELLGWLFGTVLAVGIVRRGGGRAEKLFLTGCVLMFTIQLISPFLSGLASTLLREGRQSMPTAALVLQLPVSILGLAGFACLVYAFWARFWRKRRALA